jgi:YidC/Oxa1 family membrane protein insertase
MVQAQGTKMIFRGMCGAILFVTYQFPAVCIFLICFICTLMSLLTTSLQGIFCYWVTSNLFSISQLALLRVPAVKSAFGIPEIVSISIIKVSAFRSFR